MTDDFTLFPSRGSASDDDDIGLITAYLARELSPVQIVALQDRLLTDVTFRERVQPVIEGWALPGAFRDGSAIFGGARSSAPADRRPFTNRRRSMARIAVVIALIVAPLFAIAQFVARMAEPPIPARVRPAAAVNDAPRSGSLSAVPVGTAPVPRGSAAIVLPPAPTVVANRDSGASTATTARQAGVGMLSGSLSGAQVAGKKIRFSGYIKTEGVTIGQAGLWFRVDAAPGRIVAFDNMDGRGATGTADWRQFTIELTVDSSAVRGGATFGPIMPGNGIAWFDDLTVEVDGQPLVDSRFDFGFEAPSFRGFVIGGSGYAVTLDNTVARSGRQSVRMIPAPGVNPLRPVPPPPVFTDPAWPFTMTQVTTFNLPWRIAFLPNGHMLITEKTGGLWWTVESGVKQPVFNVPRSEFLGNAVGYPDNGGMLGVYVSPRFASDSSVYLTYSEPGPPSGSGLALARARLSFTAARGASLEDLRVIWRDGARGRGGQVGGAVTFSPDGQYLFLALGDRNRITPSQDPDQPLGKILRLTLDGKPAPGNPQAGKVGAKTVGIIDWQADANTARNAAPLYTYTFPGDNLTPSETWSTGHRNPLGMIFTPDGRLWEIEHGPYGGDELNLIEPGKNYGWPLVSQGSHYNRTPIPLHQTRPDLAAPVIQWSPVIAPGNIALYNGAMFPQWNGSALITGLGSRSLSRVTFNGSGGAATAERWNLGREIRDVAVGPDGSVWLLVNEMQGGLLRLTPK